MRLHQFLLESGERPYRELVQYHCQRQSATQLRDAGMGEASLLPKALQPLVESYYDELNERLLPRRDLWQKSTCREAVNAVLALCNEHFGLSFVLPVDAAKMSGVDQELAFGLFQTATLSFGYTAVDQSAAREFMGIPTTARKSNVGLLHALFGARVKIEIPGPDGSVITRSVTKRWLEQMIAEGQISEADLRHRQLQEMEAHIQASINKLLRPRAGGEFAESFQRRLQDLQPGPSPDLPSSPSQTQSYEIDDVAKAHLERQALRPGRDLVLDVVTAVADETLRPNVQPAKPRRRPRRGLPEDDVQDDAQAVARTRKAAEQGDMGIPTSFPWASAVALLHPLVALGWMYRLAAANGHASPVLTNGFEARASSLALGYGLANLGYLLLASGLMFGKFGALKLRTRPTVLVAALTAWLLGTLITNVAP